MRAHGAVLSLLAASACGKMRLVTMVKVPRRENKSLGEAGVLAHAYNPRSQAVEVGGVVVNSRPNKQTNKQNDDKLFPLHIEEPCECSREEVLTWGGKET